MMHGLGKEEGVGVRGTPRFRVCMTKGWWCRECEDQGVGRRRCTRYGGCDAHETSGWKTVLSRQCPEWKSSLIAGQ